MNVQKMDFMYKVIFQINHMPGVLIVEAFGQAAALTAHGIDPKEYKDKLVFLMSEIKQDLETPDTKL